MSVPTHGYNCITTKMYNTVCKYCLNKVIYFECSCGSKVFLEQGLKHFCEGSAEYYSNPFDDLIYESVQVRDKEQLSEIVNKLRNNTETLEEKSKPPREANGYITRKLIFAANQRQKKKTPKSIAFTSKLWAFFLYSLEEYNLCGNCQKPIKTRINKNQRGQFQLAEIPSHYEIIDIKGNSVFRPSAGKIRYAFVEKHIIYNSKCSCSFVKARKLGNLAEQYFYLFAQKAPIDKEVL